MPQTGVAVPQAVKSLTIGGRTFVGDEVDNLLILNGIAAAANATTLRKPNVSAGYQVPAGKKYTIYAIDVQNNHASSTTQVSVGYADNDIGLNSGSALTNPVYANTGTNSNFSGVTGPHNGGGFSGSGQTQAVINKFVVPAGKYPFCQANSGSFSVQLFGIEENI
jgi:hypothetical protein